MAAAKQRKDPPAYKLGTMFGLAKDLGMSPEDTKEMAYSLIGKDSLKKFTQKEINEVCYELMIRKDQQKQRPGRMTDYQLYRVRELERLLGWDENPIRLANFIKKQYGMASIMWMTVAQGAKLIEALKSMYERESKREAVT